MNAHAVSVRVEAYERLARARRHQAESFSDVIMRARWDTEPRRASEFLRLVRERGPMYGPAELDAVENAMAADAAPRDKWPE